MARTEFLRLTVSAVDRLTDDSAAVTFAVPDELRERFVFRAGQTLTVRRGEQRRSYSICAPAGRAPRIAVREVAGGEMSGWLVRRVRVGDVLDVAPPTGAFSPDLTDDTAAADTDALRRHVLVAAGSGITPVLSITATLLAAGPRHRVTLFYGNRRSDSVMFADEIADLKDAYPDRLQVVHVLSREPQEVELLNGRLDTAKLRVLLPALVDVADTDHWWLCGPFGMVTAATDVLTGFGVEPGRIHRELFYVEDTAPPPARHVDQPTGPGAQAVVVLDGRTVTCTVPADTAILDAAQRVRPDLPFACKGGVCGTCRAHLTSGEVRMRRNYALEQSEVDAGYVLTCQAVPVSDSVTVDFDA